MPNNHHRYFVVAIAVACVWFGPLPAAEPALPAAQVVDVAALEQVEGLLEVRAASSQPVVSNMDSQRIEFRFAKPFSLWVRDEKSGVECVIDETRLHMYLIPRNQVVSVDLTALARHRWLTMLLSSLDFAALLDPQRLSQVKQHFSVLVHRGVAPPCSHDESWSAREVTDGARGGDWLIMTARDGGLYCSLLGLGRIAIRLGPRMGIPTEFRYYRCRELQFVQTVHLAIESLRFNQERPRADYTCSAPPTAATIEGSDYLVAMIIGRVALWWERLKSKLASVGRQLFPNDSRER